MNEICIDIETIPAQGQTQEQRAVATSVCTGKRAVKDSALSPYSGQIICLGVGIGDHVATLAGMPEKDILEAFWTLMGKQAVNPRYVTFNGKKFDIPFILARSGILGIKPTVVIPRRRYYNDKHFDVLEELTNYYEHKWLSLKEYCWAHGIAHTDTIDGSMIYSLWAAGDTKSIEHHCAEDLKSTMALYNQIKGCY